MVFFPSLIQTASYSVIIRALDLRLVSIDGSNPFWVWVNQTDKNGGDMCGDEVDQTGGSV